MRRGFLALVVLLVTARLPADTLPVVADTHTRQFSSAAYGRAQTVTVKSTTSGFGLTRRGTGCDATSLCQGFALFDLSALPVYAPIQKASLRIWVDRVHDGGTVDIVPVLGAWAEASLSSATLPPLGSPLASLQIPADTQSRFLTVDVTALVQDWWDGLLTNYGIALVGSATDSVWVDFISKEGGPIGQPMEIEVVQPGPEGPAGPEGPPGPGVGPGEAVTSLNGQTDAVTLAGSNGLSVTQGGGTVTVTSNATPSTSAGTIVSRDAVGSFSAGTIGITGNLDLPYTASPWVGVITVGGGIPLLHNFGSGNIFVGVNAGNMTLTGSQNTGVGWGVLGSDTTGWGNSAFGIHALSHNTTGEVNAAFGDGALSANTTGIGNSAFGVSALASSQTASYNSAFGYLALQGNTTGWGNSAFGKTALWQNTTGSDNSAVGDGALRHNTTGSTNSAFGAWALNSNTTGNQNSAFGRTALQTNTTGNNNSAFGQGALLALTTGSNNSAFGHLALQAVTDAPFNSAFGYQALYTNATGWGNSAVGSDALYSSTGQFNTALGRRALVRLVTGSWNTAVGANAGDNLVSGDNNIYLGNHGGANESDTIRIGGGQDYRTFIAGIWGATSAGGLPVYVNSDHQLGILFSSARFKEDIRSLNGESDVLMKLRPVSFYYRPEYDSAQIRQYGLVAEEVAAVAPQLVAYDEGGAPHSVRYHFVNAMLLNEVQKQRAKIQDLEARLARLEAALTGR